MSDQSTPDTPPTEDTTLPPDDTASAVTPAGQDDPASAKAPARPAAAPSGALAAVTVRDEAGAVEQSPILARVNRLVKRTSRQARGKVSIGFPAKRQRPLSSSSVAGSSATASRC